MDRGERDFRQPLNEQDSHPVWHSAVPLMVGIHDQNGLEAGYAHQYQCEIEIGSWKFKNK